MTGSTPATWPKNAQFIKVDKPGPRFLPGAPIRSLHFMSASWFPQPASKQEDCRSQRTWIILKKTGKPGLLQAGDEP
jgi:hypothetical protein